jgi:hypothetical protein
MLALWIAIGFSAPGCSFDESKLIRPAKEAAVDGARPDGALADVQGGRPEGGGGPDPMPETADPVDASPDVGASDIARDATISSKDGRTPPDVPTVNEDLGRAGSMDGGEVSADGDQDADGREVSADGDQNADGGEAPADDGRRVDAGEDTGVDRNEDPDTGTVAVPGDAADSADCGPTLDAGMADAGMADAGMADAGMADAGMADAGLSNLALAGTAYRWSANSSSTANANQVAEPKLNDDSTAAEVNLAGSGWDSINNAWEAAGVILARAATVTSVVYVNGSFTRQTVGTTTYSGDGNFDANFHLQVSTDGRVWTDAAGWSVAPPYPYDGSASNATYVFSGRVTGVVGVRVTGQVRLGGSLDVSWNATAREVQVWGKD